MLGKVTLRQGWYRAQDRETLQVGNSNCTGRKNLIHEDARVKLALGLLMSTALQQGWSGTAHANSLRLT